ncbi:MAG: LysR family transcriptional regulator [Gammaproteobacteria bacterium]|nr:LysR family transcriptional regulator [Gammaproteobacteria bacterium]
MIPADDMLLFIDIVNFKSFSKAAEKHGITAAAVSKRISHLEESLDVKLMTRSTRKLTLTEAGEVLYKYCAKIYLDLEEAFSAVIDAHAEPQGHLTIVSTTNFSNLILAPLLPGFLSLYKGISIRVLIEDSNRIPEIGSYDLAIRTGKLADSNVIARKILTVRMLVCASPEYIKKHGCPDSPDDLVHHNCIDYDYHRNTTEIWGFKKDEKLYEVKVKGNLSANNALFVKHAILKGLGIAWLPDFMVKMLCLLGCLFHQAE